MMKQKYEFSVRMQQRHLKAIVAGGSASVAFGRGIGSASAAFRTEGAGLVASAARRMRL